MFESRYSKVLTSILIVVIIAIVVLLGFLSVDYIKKVSVTKEASDFVEEYQTTNTITGESNFNENTDISENISLDNLEGTPSNPTNNAGSTNIGKKIWNNLTVVGTMKIPKINLNYPIVEEISSTALEKALIVLWPSGDTLNLPGNTVIAGHNYRNGTFFSNIKKLTNGDKIYIKDFRGTTVIYEVYNNFTASSTDTSFYSRDTSGAAEITLSTCTDASNDQRTIIFAKQI